jgi:hypothetical protein
MLPENAVMASLLLSMGGAHLAHIVCMAGNVTPSNKPSMIRAAISTLASHFASAGVRIVKMAVVRIPPPKRYFPPNRLARKPVNQENILKEK